MKVFLEKILEHNFKLPPEKGKLYLIVGFVRFGFGMLSLCQYEENDIYCINSFDFNIDMDKVFDLDQSNATEVDWIEFVYQVR